MISLGVNGIRIHSCWTNQWCIFWTSDNTLCASYWFAASQSRAWSYPRISWALPYVRWSDVGSILARNWLTITRRNRPRNRTTCYGMLSASAQMMLSFNFSVNAHLLWFFGNTPCIALSDPLCCKSHMKSAPWKPFQYGPIKFQRTASNEEAARKKEGGSKSSNFWETGCTRLIRLTYCHPLFIEWLMNGAWKKPSDNKNELLINKHIRSRCLPLMSSFTCTTFSYSVRNVLMHICIV